MRLVFRLPPAMVFRTAGQYDSTVDRTTTPPHPIAMSWIRTIEEAEAGEELAGVYERIRKERGKLSNIMRVQSLHPRAMAAHMDLYMAIMFGRSGLSREEREMIAVVVSAANQCEYCIRHHAAALNAYWRDEARLERFAADFRSEDLSLRMRAVLEYADLLTRSPSAVAEEHIQAMREQGMEDEEVLAANLIVAYFNFVNRIAEGLGVEVTPEEVGGYKY
jgi:uncharacterized peroxidase-related enzyme